MTPSYLHPTANLFAGTLQCIRSHISKTIPSYFRESSPHPTVKSRWPLRIWTLLQAYLAVTHQCIQFHISQTIPSLLLRQFPDEFVNLVSIQQQKVGLIYLTALETSIFSPKLEFTKKSSSFHLQVQLPFAATIGQQHDLICKSHRRHLMMFSFLLFQTFSPLSPPKPSDKSCFLVFLYENMDQHVVDLMIIK